MTKISKDFIDKSLMNKASAVAESNIRMKNTDKKIRNSVDIELHIPRFGSYLRRQNKYSVTFAYSAFNAGLRFDLFKYPF